VAHADVAGAARLGHQLSGSYCIFVLQQGQGQSLSLELDPVTYPPAPSQALPDPPQPPSVIDANGPRITLLNLDPSTPIDTSKYALVCDVRSPDEYEEDRIFSAISTPVLSNGQVAYNNDKHASAGETK
jgi:hypothetical protein